MCMQSRVGRPMTSWGATDQNICDRLDCMPSSRGRRNQAERRRRRPSRKPFRRAPSAASPRHSVHMPLAPRRRRLSPPRRRCRARRCRRHPARPPRRPPVPCPVSAPAAPGCASARRSAGVVGPPRGGASPLSAATVGGCAAVGCARGAAARSPFLPFASVKRRVAHRRSVAPLLTPVATFPSAAARHVGPSVVQLWRRLGGGDRLEWGWRGGGGRRRASNHVDRAGERPPRASPRGVLLRRRPLNFFAPPSTRRVATPPRRWRRRGSGSS